MKTPKEFKKIDLLLNVINSAKDQAKEVILKIKEERDQLDMLESNAKKILKM